MITNKLQLIIEHPDVDSCKKAISIAVEHLSSVLSPHLTKLIKGTRIIITSGLISSGGQTYAEEKKIILDADKNELSLQQVEDYLVEEGILSRGDWTMALPDDKDKEWSCLTYQLVHEIGHIIDGLAPTGNPYKRLSVELSPTLYGKSSESEAFAEAFTYYVFGLKINERTSEIIKRLV